MELVYMDGKKEPYTTSEIIAECAEVTHHTIQELLRNTLENRLADWSNLERCHLKCDLYKVDNRRKTIF